MPKKIDPWSLRRLLPDLNRFGCTSYWPGHKVHWIQALHSVNKPEVAAQTWSGKVVTVQGEVLTVRKADNSLIRFRNHDTDRLVVILKHTGVEITVNDQYAILRAGITLNGSFCVSVQADKGEPLGPCKTPPHYSEPEPPTSQPLDEPRLWTPPPRFRLLNAEPSPVQREIAANAKGGTWTRL